MPRVRLLERDYVVPNAPVGSEHDVGEEEAALLYERGLAEPATPPRSETPDATWTIKELQAHAEELGVDLGTARKKDDILAVLNAPPKDPNEPNSGEGDNDGDGDIDGEGGSEGDDPPST